MTMYHNGINVSPLSSNDLMLGAKSIAPATHARLATTPPPPRIRHFGGLRAQPRTASADQVCRPSPVRSPLLRILGGRPTSWQIVRSILKLNSNSVGPIDPSTWLSTCCAGTHWLRY